MLSVLSRQKSVRAPTNGASFPSHIQTSQKGCLSIALLDILKSTKIRASEQLAIEAEQAIGVDRSVRGGCNGSCSGSPISKEHLGELLVAVLLDWTYCCYRSSRVPRIPVSLIYCARGSCKDYLGSMERRT